MKEQEIIGKYFEMTNIDGSIMEKFEITHVRNCVRKAVEHPDGSYSPTRVFVEVSGNGFSWWRDYGDHQGRIVEGSAIIEQEE